MARLWRLSVVVMLLTFAPMQARAECAWVLWGEEEFFNADDAKAAAEKPPTDKRDAQWRPVMGAPSAVACVKLLNQLLDKRRQDPQYTVTEFTTLHQSKTAPATISFTTYSCLPDTIDPRGPKGGGR